jgi:hypothetical protein
MDKALEWRRDDDALGTYKKLLDEFNITNQDCRDRLVRAANAMSEENLRKLGIMNAVINTNQDGMSPNGPMDLDMQVALGFLPHKRGTGMEDLEGRLEVARAKTTLDKVEIMSRLQHLVPKEPEKCLMSGALTFYKKYMKKLTACLDSHFTHDKVIDVNGFCVKYPKYSHTKWTCTCSM